MLHGPSVDARATALPNNKVHQDKMYGKDNVKRKEYYSLDLFSFQTVCIFERSGAFVLVAIHDSRACPSDRGAGHECTVPWQRKAVGCAPSGRQMHHTELQAATQQQWRIQSAETMAAGSSISRSGSPSVKKLCDVWETPLIRTLWRRGGNPAHPFGDCYPRPRHVK